MNKFILITGGARSGKSLFAEQLALRMNDLTKSSKDIAYIATGVPFDDEFKDRINHHQKNRDKSFKTYEEAINIDEVINKIFSDHNVFLLDCITTWLGNLFCKDLDNIEDFANKTIDNLIGRFCEFKKNCLFKKINNNSKILIIVSNELGLGLVPEDKMSRLYRDIHGRINQKLALQSSAFYFTLSGIPQRIK